MYLTTIEIKREGDKPCKEQYLVEAVNLTDVEVKIHRDFIGVQDIEVIACKKIHFIEIFENGEGTFYEIKNEIETLDNKKVVETYLLEATDDNSAIVRWDNLNMEGHIVGFNKKPYMGIIR